MRSFGIITLLAVLLFSGCRKDVNDIKTTTTTVTPDITLQYVPEVENIQGDLLGFVFDEAGEPVTAATVSLNGQTVNTDDFGHFLFEGQTMNAKGQVVQITKDGFFEGSRTFFPKANNQSRVRIQLLEKAFTQSFEAADGGTITDGNAVIEFSADAIRNAAGEAYNGTVSAAVKWLDPSNPEVLDQMPGALQGVTSRTDLQALASYGMVAVELQGTSGEYLNIADGKTATLNMPVPSEMQAQAPSEIPLWSYNEEFGVWAEEGTATLINGTYVGEVSHFSFWNCDIPFDYVTLEMTIVDQDGNPLANTLVSLSITDYNGVPYVGGSGSTDENGYISGKVPANEGLTMAIVGQCLNALSTSEIGPFSVDTDLGNIAVTNPIINGTEVSGRLLDCNGNEVVNGLVISEFNGERLYHYVDNANFTIYLTSCPGINEVTIYGVNLDDLTQSAGSVVPTNTTTDLMDIDVCGNIIENTIVLTLDGVTVLYENPYAYNNASDTTWISTESQQGYVSFSFGGKVAGDYSADNLFEVIFDQQQGWGFESVGTMSYFEVYQYDTKIRGELSGDFVDFSGVTHTVEATFDLNL